MKRILLIAVLGLVVAVGAGLSASYFMKGSVTKACGGLNC